MCKKYGIIIGFDCDTFGSRQFPDLQGQLSLRQGQLHTLVLDNEYTQTILYKSETLESELDMPTDYSPLIPLYP